MTFNPFPKLARLSRECTITEKLDGTNAQVLIDPVEDQVAYEMVHGVPLLYTFTPDNTFVAVWAGSRTRMLRPGKTNDNYGFAEWVFQNYAELVQLGPGRHFGEWWGKGIQRGYGLTERRFSLFDTKKWENGAPECCHVVPVLFKGDFHTSNVADVMWLLELNGSFAAPGFMNPEGVVVWHSAARTAFKKTFENDENGKEAA